jgi:hypothetical protein
MATTRKAGAKTRREALAACLDEYSDRYGSLAGAADFGAYLDAEIDRADEEVLTEPILEAILRNVLGFPVGAFFPQLGKGGLKPDFTPDDLIAHPFVLDAKSSGEVLSTHEPQIRRYMAQRSLDYGILFNLREIKVYRRGATGPDAGLSFALRPVWQATRGEALAVTPDVGAFDAFCSQFAYRSLSLDDKITHVREQPTWSTAIARGDPLEVDVEALVNTLRRLSKTLAADVAHQPEQLDGFLAFNPGRAEKILRECELLALDLDPGADAEQLPKSIDGWRTRPGLPGRVWRQYCLRVAYLALTRVLLYRSWEDVGFVDEYLYDGGFDQAYERLSRSIRDVLKEAFAHGSQRYRWLYGVDSNYDWYTPREPALADVLYFLAPLPLGKLDADVLGGLYVSYVDEIDRDRLGQFFTPREVVRFMLDRAGFRGPRGVFRVEGDERKPVRIFDFATGSGGFLVEAARRIVDEGGIEQTDTRAVREALAAIVNGFFGGEISPFPYYLTEVNLLLQVSRLVGALSLAHESTPPFVLGVVHADSLTTKSGERSLEGLGAPLRADRSGLIEDERFGLVPLDPEKRARYETIAAEGGFDLVIGNPPYVAEANNRPLFERLRAIPAWDGIYRGKTDYLYYFLLLAVEKLAPGGRLCVITPAGWMNAGNADFLRERLASELRLDELFLFGSYRLFAADQGPAPTPTVESAILLATKAPAPKGHKLRVVALEDEAAAGNPSREALLEEMTRRASGRQGRRRGIHVHDVLQAELRPEYPWPIKHGAKDVGLRAVSHLQNLLGGEAPGVQPLGKSWKVFMGIETGADAYSPRIYKRMDTSVRAELARAGVQINDPILQLPPGAERESPWQDHPEVLTKAPEASGVLYGVVDPADYVSFVRLDRGDLPPDTILAHLEVWKPVLRSRAEISRNAKRKWWETAWPRNADELAAPKVIAVHRTDRGRFALDEHGEWGAGKATAVIVGRSHDMPVAYLCGLLNSELLDLWYGIRGRVPRDIWRDYEPKPMNEMPYRRPEGDPRADEVADLVRRIAANRRALLPFRPVVRDLGRIVKDPWKDGPVEIEQAALLGELPAKDKVSVRLDSSLSLTGPGTRGKPLREGRKALVLRRGKAETARVEGDPARLDLLERLLGGRATEDLGAVLLPKDLDAFERLAAERAEAVRALLAEGRELVERVERLVCALYDVPADLTDEVVAHAVERARRST